MTGTYQLPDGRTMPLNSPKNAALFKKIIAREIFANLTSVVQGCLDADLLADGDSPVIDPDEFLNRSGKHQCPFCGGVITDDNMITDTLAPLEGTKIETDDYDPDFRFLCPICGAQHHTESAARYCCESEILYRCPECLTVVPSNDLQPLSVPDDAEQWFVVSKWLGTALAAIGEPVLLTNEGAYLWARAKAQPSLEDDPKIAAICALAEILEGQKNFREVK